MNRQDFYDGKSFDAYEYMGAHICENGVRFCTFAPNASGITLIGEFSNWNEIPMNKTLDGNFYECYVENAKPGMMYKYRIYHGSSYTDHCDPYGYGMELRPASASIIRDLNEYSFTDEEWMKNRSSMSDKPLNIYEVHAGSWKTKVKLNDKGEVVKNSENTEEIPAASEITDISWNWYNYRELADKLIPYVTENGYNYIELMPVNEYPCDESWGYQSTGFFSPTSRYGTAADLMEFIDACHNHNIGVLLDFVPVHFAIDAYGLAKYDGTPLYEYPNSAVGISEWGSCNFIHSRGEIRSFLQSSADYWLSRYHFDGLRMDAISRIIYWYGEPNRGVNGNSVNFIKFMNEGLKVRHPGILLAAEDSTDFPGVTKPSWLGGLGFDYKWDMGWMNDTLSYFAAPPSERREKYHKLTFSMMYYYNERYLLPLSHDENVHGKATIINKMYGDYEIKFPQARAFYMYMYAHPGKKLNFMGNELGVFREWTEKQELDWELLKYPIHDGFYHYMRKLNTIYLEHTCLSSQDYIAEGFRWIDCHQEDKLIYAIERKDSTKRIISVFNFDEVPHREYRFYAGKGAVLKLLLSSDEEKYGGASKKTASSFKADKDGFITLNLPAYSGIMLVETLL